MGSSSPPQPLVALVVGVTGMAGFALAEALKKPSALGAPWKVIGASRARNLPTWFPTSLLDDYIAFDALDPIDIRHKRSSISPQLTHLFWVALQVRPTEEANISVNSSMLSNVLDVLVLSPPTTNLHVVVQTGTKNYLGPIFDPIYGPQTRILPPELEPPFREDMPRLPYPNFYYALEDVVKSYAPAITWSVHRPGIIYGASSKSVYNFLLGISVYALICKHEGKPFRFPGNEYTWQTFYDVSDVRLLAEQEIWAGLTEEAKNQAFNCSNGDVFTWKSLWKVLCEIFDVEFVPFVPMDEEEQSKWVEQVNGKGEVWDAIVEEHGLCKTKLSELIASYEGTLRIWKFPFQHVASMNKSRGLGFFGYVDTIRSVGEWVEKMRDMNILPRKGA